MQLTQDENDAISQQLTDNLNSNAQISAYCSAITNTTVVPSQGAWYQPFMTNLATAQGHASLYLNTIGPDAWSTIPNAIVNYGQTYQTSIGFVQEIMNDAGPNPLTTAQLTEIQEIYQGLSQSLTSLLGTSTDTNLAQNGNPPPTQPTIYGCLNDLTNLDNEITTDNNNLTTGQNGAAQEVSLLTADETTMQTDINTLTTEIAAYNKYITDSEVGLGVSIFVTVVGIALAPVTAGVIAGVGIAGLGASIAADVVYSDKVKAAQNQIAADQVELTTDQQQVAQLNAIISAITSLSGLNKTAQTALEGMVNTYTNLENKTQSTLTQLTDVDAAKSWWISVSTEILNSLKDWTNLINLAQGILNSTLNPQTLTPPPSTAS